VAAAPVEAAFFRLPLDFPLPFLLAL